MKFETVDEKENPMLKRKEIVISLDYEGGSTPSKADLQKTLSDQLKANIENVEISKILSETGRTVGKAWIKVWYEKKVPIYSESKKAETPKPQESKAEKAKEVRGEKMSAEEQPKEEVKQEAPKEEPKGDQ